MLVSLVHSVSSGSCSGDVLGAMFAIGHMEVVSMWMLRVVMISKIVGRSKSLNGIR